MFKVYLTSFGFYLKDTFKTYDEARNSGLKTGFTFRIDLNK